MKDTTAITIMVAIFLAIIAFLALPSCAIGRAWDEADYRARYAPIAKEVVKP